MKVQIYNWAGERRIKEDIEALGYKHYAIVEGDVFQIAKQFIELGDNVMILNANGITCDFVVAVDSRNFGQR